MGGLRDFFKFTTVSLLAGLLSFGAGAQQAPGTRPEPLKLLTPAQQRAAEMSVQQRWVAPGQHRLARLDHQVMGDILSRAPEEIGAARRTTAPVTLTLPTPEGGAEVFEIWRSPIMAPELAQWLADQGYPMETYKGRSLSDPTATVRLDFGGPKGFHARILGQDKAYQIDPYERGNRSLHTVYHDRHYPAPRQGFRCDFHNDRVDLSAAKSSSLEAAIGDPEVSEPPGVMANPPVDELRTYRLANAATGEYTTFHGGTQADGQAAIVTAMNRVNQVYERDLSIRMILVANNQDLVYTNGATDPYTNNNGGTMLGQNQTNCDSVIGDGNYDIGHVFSTGGGGVAGLGVVCSTGNKARGVTGQGSPTGDPFWIDYVAHEMGHQWGGNHPFDGTNGACSGGNRNDSTAYEPGSGSSIQAYAGICGADNLQSNSDDFFLAISLDEMLAFAHAGGTCEVNLASGNSNQPTVSAGSDYTIPANTPFQLTALNGQDLDGDSLTYSWEQFDLSPGAGGDPLSNGDQGDNPIIRAWPPTPNPVRLVPNFNDLQNNTFSPGEILPTTSRTLTMRVIVRDNNPGGGMVNSASMTLTSVDTGSPFQVTSPNGGESLAGPHTVTWDVAGTTGGGINTANVDILLSTDSGATFPTTLLTGTPNDGSQSVLLPNINTTTARIKVIGSGNIFFDISNGDFTIAPGCTPPSAPTNVMVSAPVDNVLHLNWDPVPGATSYTVWRYKGGCPGGTFTQVGTAASNSFTNNLDVHGGVTYAYYVTATDSCFTSDPSACAEGTATGTCTLPPDFDGLVSVTNPASSTCTLDLSWAAGLANCGGPVSYDIFRSETTPFTPMVSNRIATGVSGTTFSDSASLADSTTYYYIVRATDGTNGEQDTNTVEQNNAPTGVATLNDFFEDFEGATSFTSSGLWHQVSGASCGDPAASQTFYYGQDGTCDYDTGAQNSGNLTSPSIANITATSELQFTYLLGTENFGGYDTAIVQVSADGGAYGTLDQDDTNGGTLVDNGTTGGTMAAKTISLAAYAGSDIEVRFAFDSVDDVSNGFLGWFVDDVRVTDTGTIGTCTTSSGNTPQEVSPSGDMTAAQGSGTSVDLTYTAGCGNTDTTVFLGSASGNLGGGPDFTSNQCGLGSTGSLNFDPGDPVSGQFFYFLLSGNDGAAEGSYGQTSGGAERGEVDGLTCDFTQSLGGSCI